MPQNGTKPDSLVRELTVPALTTHYLEEQPKVIDSDPTIDIHATTLQIDLVMKRYQALDWLAEHMIPISTNELRLLIDSNPEGFDFNRGGFRFQRVGKIGKQSSWQVIKRYKKAPESGA